MDIRRQFRRLQALGIKKALQMKWENFLWTKLFSFGELLGLSILPSHFYSPVPNTRILRKTMHRWNRPSALAGVAISLENHETFLRCLEPYVHEIASLPAYAQVVQQGLGEGYSEVDAHILYLVLRYIKPRHMIEVGSGVSTLFALEGLRSNTVECGKAASMTCIEPYPRRGLQKLADSGEVHLVQDVVQNVPVETFHVLQENDVLFIDSSHVLKLDSDVQYLYLEVLPQLNKGVVIHIHDVFFPFATPEPEVWIFRQHQFWNESPFVQAFLAFNTAFEIMLCGSYVHHYAPHALQRVLPSYDPACMLASSLWIRKVV
ncbi:MAG: class I SAM-dependent methyltransferase [Bacteroidota bacterium]|nr:class I SAM-dependent methyltransferase [Candidatus Kapabacteria bacterium]MDW8219065.1 class I SAM-dependent methyltransferase [Bacteroidota bacterium]